MGYTIRIRRISINSRRPVVAVVTINKKSQTSKWSNTEDHHLLGRNFVFGLRPYYLYSWRQVILKMKVA